MNSEQILCHNQGVLTHDESQAYRLYHVRVNGKVLGVVRQDRLQELLVSIKGLRLYRLSCNLADGESFETDIQVHGRHLHVFVQVLVWKTFTGVRDRFAAVADWACE